MVEDITLSTKGPVLLVSRSVGIKCNDIVSESSHLLPEAHGSNSNQSRPGACMSESSKDASANDSRQAAAEQANDHFSCPEAAFTLLWQPLIE